MKPTIYRISGPWTGTLAIIARPRGDDWLEDEMEALAESGIGVVVSLLTAEEDRDLGLNEEAEIAGSAFTVVKASGVSSLVVACLLSLSTKNIDDCFNQISNARGTQVPDTAEQLNWVCTFARDFASESIAE
jgi:hypothetical protein